ncbi:MAG TPA: response regulator transcription factor [Eubacteriales bacterium]|nr:response regulator transcription factor [Eubacteriales bacterium]
MALIYIVEDDNEIREMERYALIGSGFSVKNFEDAQTFFAAMGEGELPDLVMLDIMLPGEDGLEILKKLRANANTRRVPIILVTAKASDADKIEGLDSGADDYIAKPFNIRELISRVNALLRRTTNEEQILSCGNISLDDIRHKIHSCGESIDLTFKEYELLKYLMRNVDTVLTRDMLMNAVWGFSFSGESRTVDMHIMMLRQKLGAAGKQIVTIRNVGYMLTTGELK